LLKKSKNNFLKKMSLKILKFIKKF
ncbi:ankyrin repeat domain-containing protein, partial [Campylobacter jejuni]|nr:ankyrin repeat domain-containing protein [Campylobacter jejuni]ECR1442457.1 ankyrin repeat domain-containing protein [Campylobacter jejuni]MBX2122055.1 ankyrin repeat domain-containing protein [Campylobacter jejuni]HAY6995046.1 ankyrin repeat domain-containing protein [Campylobacter jejuni]